MDVDRATDAAEPEAPAHPTRAGGFDDVFGAAIARAVRRAVDGVGREPLGSLPLPAEPETDGAPIAAPRRPEETDLPALPPMRVTDPYELLGIGRRAPWADIAAAYKRRARAWHPDGAPAEEQERRHELLRDLNAAYAELRVRRGR